MGHPQPATPMETYNSTACGIPATTVQQRQSKEINMRFYWVRDKLNQEHLLVYWRQGSDNLTDYFTKHHSTAHHRRMRPKYLMPFLTSSIYNPVYCPKQLWGCDKTEGKHSLKLQSFMTQSVTNRCRTQYLMLSLRIFKQHSLQIRKPVLPH